MEKRKFINIVIIISLSISLCFLVGNSIINFNLIEDYRKTIEADGNLRHKTMDERELWGTDKFSKGIDGDLLTPGTAINDIKSIGLTPGEHDIVNLSEGEAIVRINGVEQMLQKNEVLPVVLQETTLIAVVEGYISIV